MKNTKHKTISILWSTSDILAKADIMEVEISIEDANKILDKIEAQHDSNIGINWDVIKCHIEDYSILNNQKNEKQTRSC